MKKTFDIKIGNKIAINKIGVFFSLIAFTVLLLIIGILFSGTLLPPEMRLIYFVEVIGRNWYLGLLLVFLTLVIGNKISSLRTYSDSKLTIENNIITFSKKNEIITIPEPRLHKIKQINTLFSNSQKTEIVTDTHKVYEIKSNDRIFTCFAEIFPNKIDKKY